MIKKSNFNWCFYLIKSEKKNGADFDLNILIDDFELKM